MSTEPEVTLTRDEIVELLQVVVPEEGDFRAFTLTQLRELHRRFTYGMNRKARLQVLLRDVPSHEIVAALRSYLPNATEAGIARITSSRQIAEEERALIARIKNEIR